MLGPYLVFLASTINGYEGTGRSLSLKLLNQLRVQAAPVGANTNAVNKKDSGAATGRTLSEVSFGYNNSTCFKIISIVGNFRRINSLQIRR